MQDDELDRFVSLLKGLLKLKAGQCDSIGDELRDHLESRVEELTEKGQSREAAIRTALEEFGDSARLAHAFVVVERHNQRRRFMRMASFSVLGVTIAGLFAGLFLSIETMGARSTTKPSDRRQVKHQPLRSHRSFGASTRRMTPTQK